MIIERIRISNYKTYLNLELDLGVDRERPIILIGGGNGAGKTTLFEAICGALYGLKKTIDGSKQKFMELLNAGAINTQKKEISLEIVFWGKVLRQNQKYILRRTYILNSQDVPVESVMLNMNGNVFVYGDATPFKERQIAEQQVSKIIKANLPDELSRYFLFDAMKSSEYLKDGVFTQIIKDNFNDLMGFRKYKQIKDAVTKVKEERAQARLEAQKEQEEYEKLCAERDEIKRRIAENETLIDLLSKKIVAWKEDYEKAKSGEELATIKRQKIAQLESQIADAKSRASNYNDAIKTFIEDVELSVFLPNLANSLKMEIADIVRTKESIKDNIQGVYSLETLRDITEKILTYLKDMSLCNSDINNDNVVDYLNKTQLSKKQMDKYSYLDESEVEALRNIDIAVKANQYSVLKQTKQDIDVQIGNIQSWEIQKSENEKFLMGGNTEIIKQYDETQINLQKVSDETAKLKDDLGKLEKKIHNYDCQMQMEPDAKFDTLIKMIPFISAIEERLLKRKKEQIEQDMCEQLNQLLLSYKDCIDRVELSDSLDNFDIRMYHKAGNQISLNHLNAASKQIFIQVLLKVLRNFGDYNPPVMIDTVMGVIDEEGREALMELYFPQLAEQTILLCTTSEIRKDSDYKRLEAYISKTYTLVHDNKKQTSSVVDGYFGVKLNYN